MSHFRQTDDNLVHSYMATLPGYEYDIFVSYRHNDNRSGWVTEFVDALKVELAATIKESISVYFDTNPHDGLLPTYDVDKSLEGKLKCLIFIPIISHTYCDPKSFAWKNEFVVFCQQAKVDTIGLDVRLHNRNVTTRILPVQIHDIDVKDQALFEKETGRHIRAIDFIFRSQGVNRPLTPQDSRVDNLDRTFYRDQVNKMANAIEQIVDALSRQKVDTVEEKETFKGSLEETSSYESGFFWLWSEIRRRNVLRAALTYIVVALLLHQGLILLTPLLKLEERMVRLATIILLIGFPLATLFAWFFEVSPRGFIRTTSADSAANPFPAHKKKPFTGTPLVSILILSLIIQYIYSTYLKSPVVEPLVDQVGNKIISIAVLPFENRGGDKRDQYIADGITDDIINRLTIISKFRVTNRGRIQQYQGNMLPLDDIAKSLEVTILLTGSVERHDKKIAIRSQLIDDTGTFIWGNTFQRTTENIMAVQSEIAKMIADQLNIQLDDREKERLNHKATDNPTAYDYYLRGRSLYYKYEPNANDSAIEQFKLAIKLDPKYARAWAGLGDAFGQKHGRFSRGFFWTDSSLVAGTRAVELDSSLSEAYKALATAYNYKEDYEKAFPLLVKSVELNPTNDQAVGNLGTNYLLRGDLPTALLWEKKGVGMNPKNWIPYQLIGWIYRLLGDLENAESWFVKSLELSPDQYDTYELLGYTYVTQGRINEALALVPRVAEISDKDSRVLEAAGLIAHFAGDVTNAKKYFQLSIDNNPNYKEDIFTFSPIGLGQILLQEGNKVEADVYLSRAMENSLNEISNGSKSFEPRFSIASIYAIRGNKEQSLIWLQKAIDLNWIDHAKIVHGPYFVKFRTDPDFMKKVEFVRKKTIEMREKAKSY
jgi:TolB-like protein/cytochrome c-type biogenesis protein CcmH/NrfG